VAPGKGSWFEVLPKQRRSYTELQKRSFCQGIHGVGDLGERFPKKNCSSQTGSKFPYRQPGARPLKGKTRCKRKKKGGVLAGTRRRSGTVKGAKARESRLAHKAWKGAQKRGLHAYQTTKRLSEISRNSTGHKLSRKRAAGIKKFLRGRY